MFRGIICLNYSVIVFEVYLGRGVIIEKYLKSATSLAKYFNNNPYHLRFLNV